MKFTKVIALCAAVAITQAAIAGEGDATSKKLVVGIEGTSDPFVMTDPKTGEYVGFDVDLINAVAKEAGYKEIELKNMPFDALIPSVITEQVDVAISMITITKERAQIVDFIGPYFNTGLDAMIRNDLKDEIKTAIDLNGRHICVKNATTCELYAATIPNVTLIKGATERDVFADIANNKCDAVVTNEPIIQYFLLVSKDKDKYYRIGKKMTFAQFGIMASKNRPEVESRINNALTKVKKTQFFKDIYKKWFDILPDEELTL